jgi:AcrR family transcriptional regulator
METKKPDRRTHRSRRLLREALLSLILEKGYDAVTIEEITERADLGRTTFYLHYRDKEELLLESIDSMVNDLVAYIAQISLPEPMGSSEDHPRGKVFRASIQRVFEHAAENADLYRIILRGEGGPRVASRLRKIIEQAIHELSRNRPGWEGLLMNPDIPFEFLSNYLAGALLGTVTWWLESEISHSPEQMADMFTKLFGLGAKPVVGE